MADKLIINTPESALQWAAMAHTWRSIGKGWYQLALASAKERLPYFESEASKAKREATRIEGAVRIYASQAERELSAVLKADAKTHIGRMAQNL
jgi:hypothetical protein